MSPTPRALSRFLRFVSLALIALFSPRKNPRRNPKTTPAPARRPDPQLDLKRPPTAIAFRLRE